MKKFTKWLGVFAVLACLCLAMVACGDDKLEGKYSYSQENNGMKMTQTIELKKDGKCTATVKFENVPAEMAEHMKDSTQDGTYTVDGDTITITIGEGDDATTQSGTIKKGKSITITKSNGKDVPAVTFKR